MTETIEQTGFGLMNSVPTTKPEQERALSRLRRPSSIRPCDGCYRSPELRRRACTSATIRTALSVVLAEARLHGLLSSVGSPRVPWPHLTRASVKTRHPYKAPRPQGPAPACRAYSRHSRGSL